MIIFEDDVTLSERFDDGLGALWEDVPEDVDILFLGYLSSERTGEMRLVQRTPAAEPTLFRPRYLWGLHAYVITAAGARKLLEHVPINAPADCFVASLVHDGQLNAYAAIEKLAHQRPQRRHRTAELLDFGGSSARAPTLPRYGRPRCSDHLPC